MGAKVAKIIFSIDFPSQNGLIVPKHTFFSLLRVRLLLLFFALFK